MAAKRTWGFSPDAGGVKVPPAVQERTRERIQKYAEKTYAGKFTRLDIRFKGVFCYIDAYQEPEPPHAELLKLRGETSDRYYERMRNYPLQLCRLRYFGKEEEWSVAFFKYSDMKYELSYFENGTFFGTPEEAFDVGAVYLTG